MLCYRPALSSIRPSNFRENVLNLELIQARTSDESVTKHPRRGKIVRKNVPRVSGKLYLSISASTNSLGGNRARARKKEEVDSKSYQTAVDKTFTETPDSPRHRVPKH